MRPVQTQRDIRRDSAWRHCRRPVTSRSVICRQLSDLGCIAGCVMWPHLTPWEVWPPLALRTLWLIPAWLLRVVAAAEAIRRFRRDSEDDRPD